MVVEILEAESIEKLKFKINKLINEAENIGKDLNCIKLHGSMVVHTPHNMQRTKFYQTIIIK